MDLSNLERNQDAAAFTFLQRLFSSFARGWPGVGLLLMRLVASMALTAQAIVKLQGDHFLRTIALIVLALGTAALLLVGLWTPVAGALAMIVEFLSALSQSGDIWIHILLGTLGVALGLLGPGAWSIDARLFGWKRIDIGDRKS